MPKKRKPVWEMTPREMLRQVFPKRVAERIEKEVSESEPPDKNHDSESD